MILPFLSGTEIDMRVLLPLLIGYLVVGCSSLSMESTDGVLETKPTVVRLSDVAWTQLNPARGDKSPKAGALWGERTGNGPAGFLLRPVDGFRSPPHIHNVAYRGVVISGLLHNDDPDAADMWMPTASFWTQPAGEVHITAAKGDDALAYIEVGDAFGVLPKEKAFDSGEKPVNIDSSNLVWLNLSSKSGDTAPKVVFLWGDPEDEEVNGAMVKLPASFSGSIGDSSRLQIVVIEGIINLFSTNESNTLGLKPGSYFESEQGTTNIISCEPVSECIIYIRSNGRFDLTS